MWLLQDERASKQRILSLITDGAWSKLGHVPMPSMSTSPSQHGGCWRSIVCATDRAQRTAGGVCQENNGAVLPARTTPEVPEGSDRLYKVDPKFLLSQHTCPRPLHFVLSIIHSFGRRSMILKRPVLIVWSVPCCL